MNVEIYTPCLRADMFTLPKRWRTHRKPEKIREKRWKTWRKVEFL